MNTGTNHRRDAGATLAALSALAIGTLLAGCWGCNQKSTAPLSSAPNQRQITPTTTDQNQVTPGHQIYLVLPNGGQAGPGGMSLPAGSLARYWTAASQPADGPRPMLAKATGAGGQAIEQTDAGYVQVNNLAVNIGNQTPGQAGTTTGSGQADQAASPVQTASPVQRVRPEFTSSVPIGVAAPGGIVDQQSTAQSRGSSGSPAKTSTPSTVTSTVKATTDKIAELLQGAQQLLGTLLPTNQAGTDTLTTLQSQLSALQTEMAALRAQQATAQTATKPAGTQAAE